MYRKKPIPSELCAVFLAKKRVQLGHGKTFVRFEKYAKRRNWNFMLSAPAVFDPCCE
jgi:hypothetical protein